MDQLQPENGDLAIVLAAGKGTRMRSELPKVLHQVAGRSLLGHVLSMLPQEMVTSVVVGTQAERVADEAKRWRQDCRIDMQAEQRGTADAVLASREAIDRAAGCVFVLFADTPLVRAETIERMRAALETGPGVVVLGFEPNDPSGYGRLLTDASGQLIAIREDKDATEAERAVRLCNSGVMAFRIDRLTALLDRIGNDNAKGEFYLTDAVEIARTDGLSVSVVTCSPEEVLGVNSRVQLAEAEAVFQSRRRLEAMEQGVTMVAPETVWLSADTVLGRDVLIEPNVFFGPGVTIEDGAQIRANCHLEGATVGPNAVVGPFARLRPGADLGAKVRIGNFVEVKNVTMGEGAKANHLSYLGDGSVGIGANIGAGTIFCNYDGFSKHQTVIEAGAFIGSNSALVAPVTIGEDAYIGSGSVITRSVEAGALALERSEQQVRSEWARKFRARMSRLKR